MRERLEGGRVVVVASMKKGNNNLVTLISLFVSRLLALVPCILALFPLIPFSSSPRLSFLLVSLFHVSLRCLSSWS